ncbi:hypothetical protein L226DRAFT_540516 [Lentinus tigrinus ALCF2SS1-7]|uniref:uncharacterized protein n=1 Tax=Lentinus tigrinus ALCF2SS1-7 TaxID=1328758 RepID=UPI001165CFC6|nr:hypothetical protein L226DRAFT_540516 [Lentinus tigrinus ALCF2SS1-7]
METLIRTPRYWADLHPNKKTVYIIPSQDEQFTDAVPFEPPNRQPNRDAQGFVNYYEDAAPEKEKFWREKIGKYLWDHVVKEDMRKKGVRVTASPDTFILAAFPKHYKLWIHRKGDPADPRRDHYLYGSRYVDRFRSPAEFFLHMRWILEGMPLKPNGRPDCKCCYCDGSRTQGEISHELGVYTPHRKDHGGGDGKGGGKDGGKGTKPRAPILTTIPFKDYTKTNLPPSS